MKRTTILTLIPAALLAVVTLPFTFADDDKKEGASEVEAGPRKGRLLPTEGPRPEFFVEEDHTVSVKFYDEALKVILPAAQEVTVIASGKERKKLTLTKKDDALVSTEPLPEGDGYNLVVQVRPDGDSRPQNFRFKFLNYICKGCTNPEYACTCEEGEELERAEREAAEKKE